MVIRKKKVGTCGLPHEDKKIYIILAPVTLYPEIYPLKIASTYNGLLFQYPDNERLIFILFSIQHFLFFVSKYKRSMVFRSNPTVHQITCPGCGLCGFW